jgi:pimeloyl-ACP methyl ester carboxylesterase
MLEALFVHGGGAHSHWWSYIIAPYFTRDFCVAAIDLSGMGDSGWRAHYNSELRAEEIRAVMAAAQLGERPFVIGHSFGGFMTMKVASRYGDTLGGAVIVDSPIRSPRRRRGIRLSDRPWATSVSTRLSTLPWPASA